MHDARSTPSSSAPATSCSPRRPRTPPRFDGAVDAMRGVGMAAHVVPRSELRTEIGSDAYFGGLVVEQSAGLNPAKLTAGLADLAEAAGRGARTRRPARSGSGPRPTAGPSSRRRAARSSRRDVIVGTNGYTGGLTPVAAAPDHGDQQLHHRHRAAAAGRRRGDQPASPAVLRHQELPLLLAADARQPDAVRRAREHVADVGGAGGGDPAAGDGRDPPAAVADAGRVRVGRPGRVHVRPDGPRGPRGRRHVRDRLLRVGRRGDAVARDAGRGVGRRRRAAGDRVAVVPARAGAVRGPGRGSCRWRASTGRRRTGSRRARARRPARPAGGASPAAGRCRPRS